MDLSTENKSKLKTIYNKLNIEDEFEVNIPIKEHQYINILKNIIHVNKNNNKSSLVKNNLLRITYSANPTLSYRVNVDGLQTIKDYSNLIYGRENYFIFRSLAKEFPEQLMKKEKYSQERVIIEDYDIKIRRSLETNKISKIETDTFDELSYKDNHDIIFRYIDRMSLIIVDNSDVSIRLDISSVKQFYKINNYKKTPYTYEAEVELVKKKDNKKLEYLDQFIDSIDFILKIIHRSNFLTKRDENIDVIYKLFSILLPDFKTDTLTKHKQINRLIRKPVVLGVERSLKELPNNYAVVDKADGERFLMLITNGECYLISVNLEVIKTNYKLPSSTIAKKYEMTLLDGEYIFLQKKNKFIYLIFDVLSVGGKDIRKSNTDTNKGNIYNLEERKKILTQVSDECFGFNFTSPTITENEMKDVIGIMEKTTIDYYKKLNNFITKSISSSSKTDIIIAHKLYLFPLGLTENEVFTYANLLWGLYSFGKINLHYKLDGIIFTPIKQDYKPNLNPNEIGINEYKWKPPSSVSIDFYINFKLDKKTGRPLKIYDRTLEDDVGFYNICHLYITEIGVDHEPKHVEFRKEFDDHYTHLPINKDGNVVDLEGNIIRDKTVVEFIYDKNKPNNFRWIPMRTRTEKDYGNGKKTAIMTWNSIVHGLTVDDLKILSGPLYMKRKKQLLDIHDTDEVETYYQQKVDIAIPMRSFHNFIKSNLITLYVSPTINSKNRNFSQVRQKRVLDGAVGRGGDVSKYSIAQAKEVVALDVDKTSFFGNNGAIQKYRTWSRRSNPSKTETQLFNTNVHHEKILNKLKFKNSRFQFIQADFTRKLDGKTQSQKINGMESDNIKRLTNALREQKSFDVISIQFAMHFFFQNKEGFYTFLDNINKNIINGGYFIATCFDGETIFNLLKDKDEHSLDYTDEKGNLNVLFKIKKLFKEKKLSDVTIGSPIEVFNILIKQDGSDVEYLVNKDWFIKVMDEYCDMECVDTNLFSTFYKDNEKIIETMHENNIYQRGLKNHIDQIHSFYTSKEDTTRLSREYSFLNRYYVFRKRINLGDQKKEKDLSQGGRTNNRFRRSRSPSIKGRTKKTSEISFKRKSKQSKIKEDKLKIELTVSSSDDESLDDIKSDEEKNMEDYEEDLISSQTDTDKSSDSESDSESESDSDTSIYEEKII